MHLPLNVPHANDTAQVQVEIFKGIFPDAIEKMVSKISKFDNFVTFIALPLETHIPKGIKQKSLRCKIQLIFPESHVFLRLYLIK